MGLGASASHPVLHATDWRGPGPDHAVPAGLDGLVRTLRRDAAFSLVTQTMVIPSGALGMEAVREIAGRYRLRYLLLCREVLAKDARLGAWAWGYATIVGTLRLAPRVARVVAVSAGPSWWTASRSARRECEAVEPYTDVGMGRIPRRPAEDHRARELTGRIQKLEPRRREKLCVTHDGALRAPTLRDHRRCV